VTKLSNKTILVLILLVAAVLRFFNYLEVPFTHDEFSALSRLNYDHFSTLIREGVMPDGHPAGIQVFLYYWVRLFGFQEWIVKLPFTVFGLFSVWLVYKVAASWFNETTGLLSAAFTAGMQYTVMYSQIARPYISGLFFSLLMVYYWSNMMLKPGERFYRNSLFFVIFASLCTYNHHFSLLFAFVVGISGLFVIKKKYRLSYMLSGVVIILLYIPHLKIFLYQLSHGGVEAWLSKPENDFFINYLGYMFNFSILSLAVTLLLMLFGVFKRNRQAINYKHYLLFFSWFIIPLLTGFFYSKYVNAVLQFSVLIFSFSYLVILLFGHIRPQKPIVNLLLVLTILFANTFSLAFTRDHYRLFYQSPYEALLEDYREASLMEGSLSILDTHHRNSAYYSAKLGIDTTGYTCFDSFKNLHEFKCFLESQSKNHPELYLGSLSSISPLAVPLIQEYYPALIWRRDYAGATSYLFSRDGEQGKKLIGKLDFESASTSHWSLTDHGRCSDSSLNSVNTVYLIDAGTKFGPTFSESFEEIPWKENDFIDISVRIKGSVQDDQFLVASLESKGKNVYWGSTAFDNFASCGDTLDQWVTVQHVLKLSDIYLKHQEMQFKVYIWNRGGSSFLVDDFQISLRQGNPLIYGLNEDFRKAKHPDSY
jgi:Dolichyl-phosphate-mannose-protein mannosyltransferase